MLLSYHKNADGSSEDLVVDREAMLNPDTSKFGAIL